jgi:shikimate kinase
MSPNVYLVGMPGSGKSRVGRELASQLDRPFVDLDKEVEEEAGCSVSAIFAYRGEPEFRSMESAALRRAAAREDLVVACGGGIVLDPANRELLKRSGRVVWLNVSLARLRKRAPVDGRRPLLKDDSDMDRLFAEREPLYREVADEIIDEHADAQGMVHAVAEAIA